MMGMLDEYLIGMGTTEINSIGRMLNLPKRNNCINDKGNDYCEKWISLLVGQRDNICLLVTYDMGW